MASPHNRAVQADMVVSRKPETGLLTGEVMALVNEGRVIGFQTAFETGLRTAGGAIDQTERMREIEKTFSRSDGGNLSHPREWGSLGDLTNDAVALWVRRLVERSRAAKKHLDTALTRLERTNQVLATRPTPSIRDGVGDLLASYQTAKAAGDALFKPQAAVQAAVKALRLFVADLIKSLPKENPARHRVKQLFNEVIGYAAEAEDRTRAEMDMWGADYMKRAERGDEKKAAAQWIECVKMRAEALAHEAELLSAWAVECVKTGNGSPRSK